MAKEDLSAVALLSAVASLAKADGEGGSLGEGGSAVVRWSPDHARIPTEGLPNVSAAGLPSPAPLRDPWSPLAPPKAGKLRAFVVNFGQHTHPLKFGVAIRVTIP